MPRKRQPLRVPNPSELDAFARQVEQALDHFADPNWLSSHSPLAAPYFLGQALTPNQLHENERSRGEALQRVLVECADEIDAELKGLLLTTYFRRRSELENVGVAQALNMSERTFYRNRSLAIGKLAQCLNQRLLPPLRPEAPSQHPLVGRAALLATALATLRSGGSVYLSGASGMGKSTLGAAVVRTWLANHDPVEPTRPTLEGNLQEQIASSRRAFWYTLRVGFNDQPASLLFALGYFLRTLGAGHTWRQLVADRGVTDLTRVMGLLRYDLTSLQPVPLLCIDEVDLLQADGNEHAQILHLLEEVRTLAPLLLIGQQVTLDVDQQLRLSGVDEEELATMLAAVNAPALSTAFQQRLLTITRGNPALILLFAALLRVGDDPETALDALAKAPTAEALFNRIWRRLSIEERTLLQQLAVFRSPSPSDAWQEQSKALEQLQQRELVHFDAIGGVQCSTHLQRWISAQIPAEQRPILHARAADVRETRAEFVGAIYHAIAGRQFARAVWLWFVHRAQEIDQGRGALALGLLQQIAPGDLPDEQDRTALRLARAELLRLAGRAEEAEQELQLTVTPPQSNLRAYADWHHAYVTEMQGRVEQALQKYRASLDVLVGLPRHNEIAIHNQLAFLHLYRQHNAKAAREQALLARAKAEAFLGDIEAMAGNYEVALDYLLSAKTSTEQSSYDLRTLSRIYSYLGVVYIKLGEYDNALLYIDQAIACDRKRGDQVGPLYDLLNRAAAHTLAGDYAQGLQDAQQALVVAERLKNSYLIAGLAAGVAEACYGLQQWETAERHALYSLQQEEEFFRSSALVVLGMLRQKQGNYEEGISLLTEAIDNVKLLQDLYTEASVWRSIGLVHREAQKTDLAQLAFETALQIYGRLNLSKEVNKTLELLNTSKPL